MSNLKGACWKCSIFDESLAPEQFYRCAIRGACPGLDFTKEYKEMLIMKHKEELDAKT